MKWTQRSWRWIVVLLAGLILLPLVMLGLGILWVTPLRVERSPLGEEDAAMVVPSNGEPEIQPPDDAPETSLLSLNPQNPVHLFLVLPVLAALILLLTGGVGGLIWWRWFRPPEEEAQAYEPASGQLLSSRVRYITFAVLAWVALSVFLIFDLLGSASLYSQFVAIYAAFWFLVGALLLHDRSRREQTLILVIFLILLFSLRFVDWNSRKPFLRTFYQIKQGMTYRQVEQVMDQYPSSIDDDTEVDSEGLPVTGNVAYTHTDEGWGDSDLGWVVFRDGRVVKIDFLSD